MTRALPGLLLLAACGPAEEPAEPVDGIELTWLGVTTWLVRTGHTTVLLDPFVSRPDLSDAHTTEEGLAFLAEARRAAGAPGIDFVLAGHSHYDHALDAGPVAEAYDAALYGSATTCHVAAAQSEVACTELVHGERIAIGDFAVEITRTIHSIPGTVSGQYAVLDAPPEPGQLGIAPHGGVLSFTLRSTHAPHAGAIWFQDTLGPLDGDDGSGEDYAALLAEGLPSSPVVWIGALSFAETEAELLPWLDAVQPRFAVPHHWDGFAPDVAAGLASPFEPEPPLSRAVSEAGAELVIPERYQERFFLSAEELERVQSAP